MGDVVNLPRKIEIQPEFIPQELKDKPKWLLWRWEKRKGQNKLTKPPYQVNGKLADPTNPENWSTFDEVLKELANNEKYHGIGFALNETDDLVAWDLDHCIDPKSGALLDWAQNIVTELKSYTEITPSAEGLRILVKGDVPADGRKKGNIECYKKARYVTITGNHYPGTPLALAPSNEELWASVFNVQDKEEKKKAVKHVKTTKDKALLYEGKWKEIGIFTSQSEADASLCRIFAQEHGGDAARIDKEFRESGLMRDKWDEVHGGKTYGQLTIDLVLRTFNDNVHLTDLGNAIRMSRIAMDTARFCQGFWYLWDGKRLGEDKKQEIFLVGRKVIDEIRDEGQSTLDDDSRKKILALANQLESRGRLESMIVLAQHQPGIAIVAEELDKNLYVFNCDNGIISKTGELLPHNFDEMITKLSPVPYNPDAKCPTWEQFLKDILIDDETIQYIKRAVGSCLSGDITEQKLFFAYGTGQNGKSTFFHALSKVFGDYFASMPVESLMASKGDQHPTVLTDLRGVRFVLASEPEEGKRFNEGLLKQITGGEPIKARRMRENYIQFESSAKLWIMGNHRPTIRGTDFAIWRRIHLIPFTVTISKAKQDKGLWQKLDAEQEGILRWCVEGYLDWQKQGLNPTKLIEAATQEYREEMDVVQEFLDEETVKHEGQTVTHSDLYGRYAGITRDKNERILSSKAFSQKLREKGFDSERRGANQLHWVGLVLREKLHKREDEM